MRIRILYHNGSELYMDVLRLYPEARTGWCYLTRRYPLGTVTRRKFSKKYILKVTPADEIIYDVNRYNGGFNFRARPNELRNMTEDEKILWEVNGNGTN